jgi:hypothetical protein
MLWTLTFLLVVGIVFYQGLQGLFSSLIMALCTLVCVLLAFNYYEPLASLLYGSKPLYADAIALAALVVLPLLTVRLLVDRFIPGNVVPNIWVDRVGGGLFGIVTALLIVGTLSIAWQMLPFGRSFMGNDFYDNDLKPTASQCLGADFTLGVVKGLSAGSMGAGEPFAKAHNDLMLELWAARNQREYVINPEDGSQRRVRRTDTSTATYDRNLCTPNCFTVQGLYDVSNEPFPDGNGTVTFASAKLWEKDEPPAEPSQVLVLRAVVTKDARDGDNWWRLMGTHFRLVAADGESFYPVGYLGFDTGKWRVYAEKPGTVEIDREVKEASTLQVDLLYRIPRAAGPAEPREMAFAAFRRISKAAVPTLALTKKGMPETKGALAKNTVYGTVKIDRPPQSALGNYLFLPDQADVAADVPFVIGIPPEDVSKTQFTFEKDGASLDLKLTKGADGQSTWADGKVSGPEKALAYNSQLSRLIRLYEPSGKKVVRVTGVPPQSSQTNIPALNLITFHPMVTTAGGKQFPAVGGWVKWMDGQEAHYVASYATTADEIQEAAGRGSEGFKAVSEAYSANRANVTEAGLFFLVPDSATVESFRFAEGTPEAHCASPLGVTQPQ